ncbi:Subtilisin-like protease SBT2.5 [Linum perenne]
MGSDDTETKELYFVFMKYDPEYDRLKADRRTKRGAHELDVYLSKKHDHLLSTSLQLGTYNKTCSLVIVDGFAVEITQDQANVLRSADGVRLVEKNQELP